MERIKYQEGYKYRLFETYSIQVAITPDAFIKTEFIRLDTDGTLWIEEGYAWDGPSGPTVDTPDSMRGSLVHDALYQLMREGHLDKGRWREAADGELQRICVEDGMSPVRAYLWYAAVREFAETAAEPAGAEPVLTAP